MPIDLGNMGQGGMRGFSMPERQKIAKKLNAIQAEVGYMAKGGKNEAQGYKFLADAQIMDKFNELFQKNKVMFLYSSKITGTQPTPSAKQTLTNVEVIYEFYDTESGESIAGVAAGQGTDPSDKGIYKAITGAIKYIFMKTFLIPTGDDPENDSKEPKAKTSATDKPPFGKGSEEDDD